MDEIAPALERYFAGQPGDLVAAWLFGSVARGTAGPESDVDRAIYSVGWSGHVVARASAAGSWSVLPPGAAPPVAGRTER